MANWTFTGILQQWGYEWVNRMLSESFDCVTWKEFDYGNCLAFGIKDGNYHNGFRVEFSYCGPKAIGHWEHIPSDPDEETLYWHTRYVNEKGIWMQKTWVWDFYDWRRYRLIMQPDPEAVVQHFIDYCKDQARVVN